MTQTAIDIAQAFLDAFNARDQERVLETVHDDVEFRFPHALVEGKAGMRGLLRQQSRGVGYRIRAVRWFQRSERLVSDTCKDLIWVDSGDLAETEAVGSVWTVRDGRVQRYVEFEDLAAALAAGGVTEADEVSGS